MDLWTALRVYAARWYVAVPVLLMSFYAAYIIGQTINPTYETAGSILLVPPLEQAPAELIQDYEPIVNPCLRPGNGPRSCASAIARILLSEGEQRRFEAEGLSPDYEISIPSDSLIIDYTVAGESASQVTETLDELVRRTNTELLGIQQTTNTPPDQIISVEPLFLADEPEEFSGGRLRVTVALALVGVIASASIAFLVDNLAGRRGGSVRRAVRTEPTAAAGPVGATSSTQTSTPTARNRRIELVPDDDELLGETEQPPAEAASSEADSASEPDSAEPGSGRRRVRRRQGSSVDEEAPEQADEKVASKAGQPAKKVDQDVKKRAAQGSRARSGPAASSTSKTSGAKKASAATKSTGTTARRSSKKS